MPSCLWGKRRGSLLFARQRSSKGFIYTVVNLAIFIDAYLYGLIIPIIPFVLSDIGHVRSRHVQDWISALLAAYGIGLLIGAPLAGHYADKTGSRKGPYLFGLIALAVSTLALSAASAAWVLVLGRFVQGASCATVHTVGVAILVDTVGDGDMGIAMGFVTTTLALGMVTGPFVGGILYHRFGYMAVFLSAYAVVAVDFVFRLMMIDGKVRDSTDQEYGTFTGGSQQGDPQLESDQASDRPASPSSSCAADLISPVDQGVHQHALGGRRHRILELLTTPRILTAILGDFLNSLILTCLETILPLHLKSNFKFNSEDIGIAFLFLAAPSLTGPFVGYTADKIGARAMVSAGLGAVSVLMICLRLIDHYDQARQALPYVLLVALGTALNMILTPVFSEAMYAVEDKVAKRPGIFGEKGAKATALGLLNMAYALGSVIGPLVGGWLMGKVGWSWVTTCAGILSGLCMIPALLYLGRRGSRTSR